MPPLDTTSKRRAHSAGKRAVNLSLSTDVLDAARKPQIDISQVCNNHLRNLVQREKEARLQENHADFIAAYNTTVNAEGLALDEWRTF